jgi:membrane protein implicated in regulation of membrane protease activity
MLSEPLLWWLIAGSLILTELVTGTFYLLMLALGATAGALAAHLGLAPSAQMVSAALLGGGAVALWYNHRRRRPASPDAQANPDVLLDIGAQVQVEHWNDDGTTRITYRGASWQARHSGTGQPEPGPHTIERIDGSILLLRRQHTGE